MPDRKERNFRITIEMSREDYEEFRAWEKDQNEELDRVRKQLKETTEYAEGISDALMQSINCFTSEGDPDIVDTQKFKKAVEMAVKYLPENI